MYRGDLIRAAMAAQLETVESVHKKAGVSPYAVTAARYGKNMEVRTLKKIADALRLNMRDLFTTPEVSQNSQHEQIAA